MVLLPMSRFTRRLYEIKPGRLAVVCCAVAQVGLLVAWAVWPSARGMLAIPAAVMGIATCLLRCRGSLGAQATETPIQQPVASVPKSVERALSHDLRGPLQVIAANVERLELQALEHPVVSQCVPVMNAAIEKSNNQIRLALEQLRDANKTI